MPAGVFRVDLTSATGSLADARLSSNVPLKDAASTFTAAQTMSGLSIRVSGSAHTTLQYIPLNHAASVFTGNPPARQYFGSTVDYYGIWGLQLYYAPSGQPVSAIVVTMTSSATVSAILNGTLTATGFIVGANQVVGARGAAVADATGAGDVVTQFNTLLARLRTHGLIAS